MSYFPRYFALESLSTNKYLRYVHEEDVVLHGHLEFSGEGVISPYTKFELEPAKTEENKGLFNIRCCYTNKYWTRKGENTRWITACTAAEPVEDRFNRSCSTLFDLSALQRDAHSGKKALTLRCVLDSRYVPVSIGNGDTTYRSCLKAEANPSHQDSKNTTFAMIDLESFVILPKVVVFKGDDGLYLTQEFSHSYLQFSTRDVAIADATNIIYNNNGTVRIKTNYGFWAAHAVVGDYWVDGAGTNKMVESESDRHKIAFAVVKGNGDNEVALRLMQNGLFCKRVTSALPNESTALAATVSSMTKETIMRVEEPVVSRTIYDVDLRLKDIRIYDKSVVLMVSKQFTNPLGVDEIIHINQTFKNETTRSWKSAVTLKLATPTTIKTSVPLIVDGEVGLWDDFEGRYEWGTETKGYHTTELSERITVPGNSTIIVHVTATRSKYDVPFSYTQRDLLTDHGVFHINKMDDGVYTGINCYNFKTQVL